MKYLNMLDMNMIPVFIMATCVLHNLCLVHGEIDEIQDLDEEVQREEADEENENADDNIDQSARDKRMNIAFMLH